VPDFSPTINQITNLLQVSDIIQRAARIANCLVQPGQGVTNSESLEFLATLNALIDSLKLEANVFEYVRRTVQTMNVGQSVYGVGPLQDFNIERPEAIPRASFLVSNGGDPNGPAEIPMRIILTFEEWQRYTVKATKSSLPLALYYEAAVPYGAAHVWPVPNVVSQIAIYTRQMLQEFLTADDAVVVRDGYREMLIYGLAVKIHEMPPYNQRPMDPNVLQQAIDAKNLVRYTALAAMPMYISSDSGARQNRRRTDSGVPGFPRTFNPYS
jgi:hypothetical protein